MPLEGPEVHEMIRVLANVKMRNLPEYIVFFVQKHLRTCLQCQSSLGRKQVQTFLDRNIEEMLEEDELLLLPTCAITRYYQSLRGEETPNDLQEWINTHIRLCADCATITSDYVQLTLGLQSLSDHLQMEQLVSPPRTRRQQTHYLRLLLAIIVVVAVIVVLLLLFLYR